MHQSDRGFGEPKADFCICPLPPLLLKQQAMENRDYSKLLPGLEQMLAQTEYYRYQPVALKLHLYAVVIEIWRVIRQFEELKANYKSWMMSPDNLFIDVAVDYDKWTLKGDQKIPNFKSYPVIDANDTKQIRDCLETTERAILDNSLNETFEVKIQSIGTALCDQIKCDHLVMVIKTELNDLCKLLAEIVQLSQEITFTDNDFNDFWNRFIMHCQFPTGLKVKAAFDKWMEKNAINEDEEQLERHYEGRIRLEIEAFFKSGFLTPRLKAQEEVNLSQMEPEMQQWGIGRMTDIEHPELHYSALRDFFKPTPDGFIPKNKVLSRYILMNRREVNAEMCMACYHFIRTMELLMGVKKQMENQPEQPADMGKKPAEVVTKEPKKRAKRGPQSALIFNSDEKRQTMAKWIHQIYFTYFDKKRKVLVIENCSYNLTDFLLAIYYVLVEQEHVISVINNKINSQYYKFLTEDCQLGDCLSDEKTFSNHLKKLISTGKDFYQLTTEIVKKNSATGGYTQKEYETMTAMTATIKKLLPKS